MDFINNVALPFAGRECLVWPYSKSGGAYGRLYWRNSGRYRIASRVVCELAHGDAPAGHEAAHSCGNRSCVNPNHLSWKTPKGNSDDKDLHGTKPRGRRSGVAKLDEAAVQAIRAAEGKERTSNLAKAYGVHSNTIRVIQRGKRWGWLP